MPCAARRINKHQELDELGATGLRSQDSLGITRARLAKQRLNESTALLDDIKNMEASPCVNSMLRHSLYAIALCMPHCWQGSFLAADQQHRHTYQLLAFQHWLSQRCWRTPPEA